MAVEVRNSHAFVAGTTTLCGSIANMIECVQHFATATGSSIKITAFRERAK
jgi:N-acetylglucosamine-6-phosphate deacetylase